MENQTETSEAVLQNEALKSILHDVTAGMTTIGTVVKARGSFQLACGSGVYENAVVMSIHPFILSSLSGDMIWSCVDTTDVSPTPFSHFDPYQYFEIFNRRDLADHYKVMVPLFLPQPYDTKTQGDDITSLFTLYGGDQPTVFHVAGIHHPRFRVLTTDEQENPKAYLARNGCRWLIPLTPEIESLIDEIISNY